MPPTRFFRGVFCVNVGAALTGSGDTLVELRCTDLGAAGDVSGLIVSEAEALRGPLFSL